MCLKAGWLNASMGAAQDALAAHNLSHAGEALNATLAASSDAELRVWYEVGALASIVATVLVLVLLCASNPNPNPNSNPNANPNSNPNQVLLCAWRRCIARAIAIVQECNPNPNPNPSPNPNPNPNPVGRAIWSGRLCLAT